MKSESHTNTSTPPARLGPPSQPIIPRILRACWRCYPLLIWLLVLAVVIFLHKDETGPHAHLAQVSMIESAVISPVAGHIAVVEVSLGQTVEAGDVIALIDSADHEARLHLAHSKLKRARTQITVAQEKFANERLKQETSERQRRLDLTREQQRRGVLIDKLVSQRDIAMAEIDQLTPQIIRLLKLSSKHITTVDRLEQLKGRKAILQQTVTSKNAQIERAREDLQSWNLLSQVAAPQFSDALRLLPFQLQVESQVARIAELELEKRNYRLLAPTSGIVTKLDFQVGEWCQAGNRVAKIARESAQTAVAFVSQARMKRVAVGDRVALSEAQRGGKIYEGSIVAISPHVESTPKVLTLATSPNSLGRRIQIQVDDNSGLVPGEILKMRFKR